MVLKRSIISVLFSVSHVIFSGQPIIAGAQETEASVPRSSPFSKATPEPSAYETAYVGLEGFKPPATPEPSAYETAYFGLGGFKPHATPGPSPYETAFFGGFKPRWLPSDQPSLVPSIHPSFVPSDKAVFGALSDTPSLVPSHVTAPSDTPSYSPSISPSSKLVGALASSDGPSLIPSLQPSSLAEASIPQSDAPSLVPSIVPSSILATITTSDGPSLVPSIVPSSTTAANFKSDYPSLVPSIVPSGLVPTTTTKTAPTSPVHEVSIVDTITLIGVSKTMDVETIEVFEKASESLLSEYAKGVSISKVVVTGQTVEESRRRKLQQTGLGVTFTVVALISSSEKANINLSSIVAYTFRTHQEDFDQLLYAASPFFASLQTETKTQQGVATTARSSEPTKFGGTFSIVAGASVALLVSGFFAGWFVRRSRSRDSSKSLNVEKSNDESSFAVTATSPNSLEAANSRGFGSSDESEATESSLSSYSSGDSSEEFIVKAGSNRYGPNGERSVEEEIENLSKNVEVETPHSEGGLQTPHSETAVTLSTCSSISPVSAFSQVKAKITPRGTKFVQFQVRDDPTEVEETELMLRDEDAEEKERIADACRDKCEDVPIAETVNEEDEEEEELVLETKKDGPPDEFTLTSFSSLSAALSCGFGYENALLLLTETPKPARLEDCEVTTPKGAFIQHNCTPDGTTFVQLNTDSAQDVGEVLSDLTDMEVKWEGNLDSKTTAVSKTPKTNNLQKFKKAPRKVIYQAAGRVEV